MKEVEAKNSTEEYTVTIENYETELTANELREQIEDQFPLQDVIVNVEKSTRERTTIAERANRNP